MLAATDLSFAGCDAVDETVLTLRELREQRREAFGGLYEPDWKTRLALAEDRDLVLAERAAATQALEDARAAVKAAKVDKKEAIASCRSPARHAAS